MPVSLPARVLSKTRSAQQTAEWIGFWALSLGAVAVCLAALIYFTSDDPVAASFVLLAIATIIGAVLWEVAQTSDRI